MTTADVLDQVQARLAAADLVAEWFHGIDAHDLDRAMAAWHPQGVSSFIPGPTLEGGSAIRAFLERMWARYSEVYHWVTNLTVTVHDQSTMHGEARLTALCVTHDGAAIREVGTVALDYTRTDGTWLISREVVTMQRRDPDGSS
jgi:ketosteroid isomerase-like protein